MAKGKRKAGHIGFQSNEVAFIEDEMAALAKEYGLELDEEVVQSVCKRKEAKRARKRQPTNPNKPTAVAPPPPPTTTTTTIEIQEQHVRGKLREIMPDGCGLAKCVVPGCACTRGDRHMVVEKGLTCEATDLVLLNHVSCKSCHHRLLQHRIAREDTSESTRDPGGFRGLQRMLSDLFQLIRFARIGGCVFESLASTSSSLDLIKQRLEVMRRRQQGNGNGSGSGAAATSSNNPQNASESLHERQIIHELSALVTKADNAMKRSPRDELPIHLACHLDAMYFHCYYAMLVLYGRNCAIIASPEIYFASIEPKDRQERAKLASFVDSEQLTAARVVKDLTEIQDVNALQQLQALRFREGIRLIYDKNIGMGGEVEEAIASGSSSALSLSSASSAAAAAAFQKKHKKKPKKRLAKTGEDSTSQPVEEMPCYPLLAQWRNNCRDWACHLFAYATPTRHALQEIAQYAPLIEIGAGTGYWSSLLLQQKVDIVAFDKALSSADDACASDPLRSMESNAYHGLVPAFCHVARGGPEQLAHQNHLNRNLFLCYPPPHDEMARKCLRYFQGNFVLHVGEWQGDTGDRRFESLLVRQFALVQRVELPNWANTAYELTIWQRRRGGEQAAAGAAASPQRLHLGDDSPLVRCAVCGNPEAARLRRCRLCKWKIYCSERCASADQPAHTKEHATRLVFVDTQCLTNVADDRFYRTSQPLDRDVDSDEQPSAPVSRLFSSSSKQTQRQHQQGTTLSSSAAASTSRTNGTGSGDGTGTDTGNGDYAPFCFKFAP